MLANALALISSPEQENEEHLKIIDVLLKNSYNRTIQGVFKQKLIKTFPAICK